MYVQDILTTRVLDRQYRLTATRQTTFDGPVLGYQIDVVADAGSYRADEQYETVVIRIAEPDREKAVAVFNGLVTVALDAEGARAEHPLANV